ncbi:hypothetical protein BH09SUM1_BH09SUM1_00740 [soil metagenome]
MIRSTRTFTKMLSSVILISTLFFASGCAGIATKGEKNSREGLAGVAAQFRPDDISSVLPMLTADSSLQDYLRYAVLRRPEVERAYYDWAASVERITIARSLPDPVFTAGADLQNAFENDLSNIVVLLVSGLAIDLPGPGKLRARADLATAETTAKYAEFQAAVAKTALDTRTVYFDLFLVSERSRLLDENRELVEKIADAVTRLNSAGLATRSDVLQIEREDAQLELQRGNLKDERLSLLLQWKSALGISPAEPDPPVPSSFDAEAPIRLEDAMLQEALATNPRLAVLRADITQAEAAVALAYRGRVPDFSLGFETETPVSSGTVKGGDTVFLPRVGITIPIWRDRIAAEIAEAEAQQLVAQSSYTTEQLIIVREFARVSFGLRETARNLALLDETLVPRQRELVALAQRGYEGGVTPIFELVEQQRRLLTLEEARAQGIPEQQRLSGELTLTILGRTQRIFASANPNPLGELHERSN